jgi:D-arabinose 1-dehydrogenase-like Zn-dependent alcohol dehydrogenase
MDRMTAMMLERIHDLRHTDTPLICRQVPVPQPGDHEILIRVTACGVCHTELDEIEGRTPPPRFPVVPGHEVAGRVAGTGAGSRRFSSGQRVGVAWINRACGRCSFCREGLENLCPEFAATGRDAHGGYAQYMTVHEDFAFPIPDCFSDLWQEKEIKSVANVARSDVSHFLELAERIPIIPEVETFDLEQANQALMELKKRKIRGAKVLVINPV